MNRLLITGANGFIGSALAERAASLGWEVTAAVRPHSDRSHLEGLNLRFIHLPYDAPEKLRQALQQAGRFDYVAHIAGTTKALRAEDYFRINADYTRHLAEVLTEADLRPKRFLFLSSLAALGPAQEGKRIWRGQPPKPVTTYGASKRAAEVHLEVLGERLPWIVLQPTAVFGPRDRDLFQFVQLVDRGWEIYIGRRPQQVSFIYVGDLVELMIAALMRGPNGQKLVATDGRDYTADALGAAARAALGRRTRQVRLPLAAVWVVAALNEGVGRWRGKMPALHREKLRELGRANWWCEASETFRLLNVEPQYDLYSGMQETIAWYRQHDWL